jgi:hypothetical protein
MYTIPVWMRDAYQKCAVNQRMEQVFVEGALRWIAETSTEMNVKDCVEPIGLKAASEKKNGRFPPLRCQAVHFAFLVCSLFSKNCPKNYLKNKI